MPSEAVQIQTNNCKNDLPRGEIAERSRRTELSRKSVREHHLGHVKHPRFRSVTLLGLGAKKTLKDIIEMMLSYYPDTVSIYNSLDASGWKYSDPVRPYDPRDKAFLPTFVTTELSVCANYYIDKAVATTGKRRAEILAEASNCTMKKICAGYYDAIRASKSAHEGKPHFEASWCTLMRFAKAVECTRQDFMFLLSTAYPDLALAFWLRSAYARTSDAGKLIADHMDRCQRASGQQHLPSVVLKTYTNNT